MTNKLVIISVVIISMVNVYSINKQGELLNLMVESFVLQNELNLIVFDSLNKKHINNVEG